MFVDDRHSRARLRIELVEVAARDEWNLHRLEVIAADDADVGVDEFLAGWRDASFDGDGAPREHLAQRKCRHAASGSNSRKLSEARPQLTVGLAYDRRLGILP